jgi:hypothetical protein
LQRKRRKPNSSDRLKKAQLSFYPEPEDYAALKALSARTGVPQQVYLRRGLDFVLRTYDVAASTAHMSAVRRRTREIIANFAGITEDFERRQRNVARTGGRPGGSGPWARKAR